MERRRADISTTEDRCVLPAELSSRKSCQYCRYKLCQAAGMKAAWVLPREDRNEREERTKEIEDIDNYVTLSSFFTGSNVTDLDIHLVRQLVR